MIAISTRRSTSNARAYWNYRRRDSSFLPMEASVNPSNRRLRPEKWEASPDRAGSSHATHAVQARNGAGNPVLHPGAQQTKSPTQFHNGDRGYKEIRGLHAFSPCRHARIYFPCSCFSPFGHYVRIKKIHHKISACFVPTDTLGGSNSISETSGMDSASAMLRRCFVRR